MLVSALLGFQQGDFAIQSTAFGKTYVSAVSEAKLLESPAWDEGESNPPVSARSAMNLARIALEAAIELPEDCEWQQGSLQLMRPPMSDRRNERWVWFVRFDGVKKTGVLPGSHKIQIMVLMNGKVVKPTVKPPAGEPEKTSNSK